MKGIRMYKVVSYYHEDPQLIREFRDRSRYLWTDHMLYTRNTVVGILSDLGDVESQTARLLKNQDDIGSMMSPYYDQDYVDQMVSLLKEHIGIAARLATATKSDEDTQPILTEWSTNKDSIIALMADVNPMGWPDYRMRPLWDAHLSMTATQIQSYDDGNWDADIASIDGNHACLMQLADAFSQGIMEQNIEQFCQK